MKVYQIVVENSDKLRCYQCGGILHIGAIVEHSLDELALSWQHTNCELVKNQSD